MFFKVSPIIRTNAPNQLVFFEKSLIDGKKKINFKKFKKKKKTKNFKKIKKVLEFFLLVLVII